jgi:hypothetical protein
MAWGKRKDPRVAFEHGIDVSMLAIDGTWRRNCVLMDISATGARLLVDGSLQGLNLKEFFLLLSSTGLAYRRCALVRVNSSEIGVRFLRNEHPKSKHVHRSAGAGRILQTGSG